MISFSFYQLWESARAAAKDAEGQIWRALPYFPSSASDGKHPLGDHGRQREMRRLPRRPLPWSHSRASSAARADGQPREGGTPENDDGDSSQLVGLADSAVPPKMKRRFLHGLAARGSLLGTGWSWGSSDSDGGAASPRHTPAQGDTEAEETVIVLRQCPQRGTCCSPPEPRSCRPRDLCCQSAAA